MGETIGGFMEHVIPIVSLAVTVAIFIIRLEGKIKQNDLKNEQIKNDLDRLGQKVEKQKDSTEQKYEELRAELSNIALTLAKIEGKLNERQTSL